MKKTILAVMMLCMGMTGCGNSSAMTTQTEIAAIKTADSVEGAQTAESVVKLVAVDADSGEQEIICGGDASTWSPFADCENLEEAENVAGIEIRVPESIEDYADISCAAMKDEQLVQVEYSRDAQHYICIRKAPGTEDISGDYNIYTEENTIDIDGREVIFKGNDGKVGLAVWTDGGYCYSIMCADLTETAAGMRPEQMKALVSVVA